MSVNSPPWWAHPLCRAVLTLCLVTVASCGSSRTETDRSDVLVSSTAKTGTILGDERSLLDIGRSTLALLGLSGFDDGRVDVRSCAPDEAGDKVTISWLVPVAAEAPIAVADSNEAIRNDWFGTRKYSEYVSQGVPRSGELVIEARTPDKYEIQVVVGDLGAYFGGRGPCR